MKVQIQIVIKTTFRLSPSKTFLWPWILRAFTSLNRVIITNALKMTVKCCVGLEWSPVSLPLSMSRNTSPAPYKLNTPSVTSQSDKRISHINVLHSSLYTHQLVNVAFTLFKSYVVLRRTYVVLSPVYTAVENSKSTKKLAVHFLSTSTSTLCWPQKVEFDFDANAAGNHHHHHLDY